MSIPGISPTTGTGTRAPACAPTTTTETETLVLAAVVVVVATTTMVMAPVLLLIVATAVARREEPPRLLVALRGRDRTVERRMRAVPVPGRGVRPHTAGCWARLLPGWDAVPFVVRVFGALVRTC